MDSNPCFTFQECWQEKSDQTYLLVGETMSKKDNGKGIQKADDSKLVRHSGAFHDIQIPIQNKFSSLLNYPPLPYKNVVTGSSSKPHDLYHVKYTEHLFPTNLKAHLYLHFDL